MRIENKNKIEVVTKKEIKMKIQESFAVVINECVCELEEIELTNAFGVIRDEYAGYLNNIAWNALSIAYADDSLSEKELEIIEFVRDGLNMDQEVFKELLEYMKSLQALDSVEKWIKNSIALDDAKNRIKEIKKRKELINETVNDLVL